MLFVITKPDVFKSPNSDTYIIFGEVISCLLFVLFLFASTHAFSSCTLLHLPNCTSTQQNHVFSSTNLLYACACKISLFSLPFPSLFLSFALLSFLHLFLSVSMHSNQHHHITMLSPPPQTKQST